VDCGGGVVLNPRNIEILRKTGTLVYLSCQPEEILRRVMMQPKRPLLDVLDPLAKIRELLKERKPFYEQADMTLDTSDGDLHRVAREVIKEIK
jgi:shikimate kinase